MTASRFNVSRWAIEHAPLTRYLMIVLLLLGGAAYFQLGQDEDPPFTFRAMVVQAFWPGATAQQMAEQVTDRIEKTLQEVPHADVIRSYTKPGESLTLLQLADDSPPQSVPDVWYQVRKKVGDMRATLPAGVIGPVFNDEFGDVYGSIFALSADGFSREELREFADMVRERLLRVRDVAKVAQFGVQPEKLFVEIPQRRLAQLGLDMNQVIAQIGAQNAVEGAGVLDAGGVNVQVRVAGAFTSVDDLARLPIRAVNPATGQASMLRLGDLATIRRDYADPPAVMVRHQGRDVIALGVSMAPGGDIIALGEALRAEAQRLRAELPAGVELVQVQDQPQAVSRSVGEFVKVLVEALVIVLAVSFVSLGLHTRPLRIDVWPGLVVAITIPLVLAITFVAMYYWGVGLHKISLGSLIIALGLLVDDAIIVVEMMVRKLEEGYDRLRAATFAFDVTAKPMLTGTLITAAGFLPIGLAKSATGEYTFAIFAVTAAALVISWVVSVYFVPWLGWRLLRVKAKVDATGEGPHELFDTPFYNRFRATVGWCVRHRWLTIGATLLTFALGLAGMGRVQQQFFPDSNRPELLVDLWLPEGTAIETSAEVARRFEARLMAEPGVASVTTWVGSGVPRFYLPLDQIFPQPNVSQAIVLPASLAERERLRRALPAILAAEFPELRGRVKLLPNGPPVSYPVMFRVVGPDVAGVRRWADEVKDAIRANPNLRGVNDNWNESVLALRLQVDQDKARALGVSSQSIAQASRTILSGTTIGQYREGDKRLDIVLRQPEDERRDLADAYVPTANGRAVPLAQVARIEVGWEPGVLWRERRQYAVTVQGDVAEGLQGATVTAQLWPELSKIKQRMPPGYDIVVAGAVAESSKGQGSIAAGVPAMLFIIFTLLMLQLHSFSRALLVFLTGPLGIAGVAAALLLLDRPFGFVALLGVIALSGMIMRNAVILIDQIEQDRARGVPAWDAIVEAAVRRFRPIVLTAAAAVLAMIPLSRSVFWGPMAVAIMGGLVVATALTLLALPAMYAAWFRVRRDAAPAA
ncbi:efflux RND transporter permease subunit [Azohydromonas sediminis]|uniref:efflux RND transporter permease subunit n=1 Tax=Azohydromonas sediminis TaxID=2259674 RepID=UPI0021752F50|nr:efflux RND transporter permease subunit [Azohydromonas sediminis]